MQWFPWLAGRSAEPSSDGTAGDAADGDRVARALARPRGNRALLGRARGLLRLHHVGGALDQLANLDRDVRQAGRGLSCRPPLLARATIAGAARAARSVEPGQHALLALGPQLLQRAPLPLLGLRAGGAAR